MNEQPSSKQLVELTADQAARALDIQEDCRQLPRWASRTIVRYEDRSVELWNSFKNFHRLLCERFGYVHDENDWQRDQLSLIEHIAQRASAPPPAGPPFSVRWAIGQLLDELPQRRDWLNPDVEKILREHIRPAPTKPVQCQDSDGCPHPDRCAKVCMQQHHYQPPVETSACRHLRRVGMATPEGKIIREQCEDCGVQLSNT